jgi:hypothetical protein
MILKLCKLNMDLSCRFIPYSKLTFQLRKHSMVRSIVYFSLKLLRQSLDIFLGDISPRNHSLTALLKLPGQSRNILKQKYLKVLD